MTIHLLDVNVLIAMLNPFHERSRVALEWFTRVQNDGWATCPLTENGVIRIMSSPSYDSPSNDPVYVAQVLDDLCLRGSHHFWADDISARHFLKGDMKLASAQLTDIYLLGLAIAHEGKFVTFDQHIPALVLPGGEAALEVIST